MDNGTPGIFATIDYIKVPLQRGFAQPQFYPHSMLTVPVPDEPLRADISTPDDGGEWIAQFESVNLHRGSQPLRKLFRMKYEPCSGRCYADDEVIKLHGFGLDVAQAGMLLDRIIAIHEPACGNERIEYGMDVDETSNTFVVSFIHYGSVEIMQDSTALGAMNKLIDAALTWYETDEAKRLLAEKPGLGHGVCEHGEDHDLRKFAMKFSGLDEAAQAAVLSAARV